MLSMVNEKRKRRSDRNHAIYALTCLVTGNFYIGLTAVSGQAKLKSVKVRWQKHVRRALTEGLDWSLCKEIRSFGADTFKYEIVEIVRSKKEAHKRERELIAEYHPELNVQ